MKARMTRLVGAKASPSITPESAGSRSSLLQDFRFTTDAVKIDAAPEGAVDSGSAVTGEESAIQSSQRVSGYVLCAPILAGLGCRSKPSAIATQSVSSS